MNKPSPDPMETASHCYGADPSTNADNNDKEDAVLVIGMSLEGRNLNDEAFTMPFLVVRPAPLP